MTQPGFHLTYRVYLTDGLPGLAAIALFLLPAGLGDIAQHGERNPLVVATIGVIAALFAPGVGLVFNLLSHMIVDGLFGRFWIFAQRPRRCITRYFAEPDRSQAYFEDLVKEIKRLHPSGLNKTTESRSPDDWVRVLNFVAAQMASKHPAVYTDNQRYQGAGILCRTLALLCLILITSLWVGLFNAQPAWGLTALTSCVSVDTFGRTSTATEETPSNDPSTSGEAACAETLEERAKLAAYFTVALILLGLALLVGHIVSTVFGDADLLERYLSLEGTQFREPPNPNFNARS